MCLFQLVDKHGVLLYNEIKKFDRKVFFVYGGTDTETREKMGRPGNLSTGTGRGYEPNLVFTKVKFL